MGQGQQMLALSKPLLFATRVSRLFSMSAVRHELGGSDLRNRALSHFEQDVSLPSTESAGIAPRLSLQAKLSGRASFDDRDLASRLAGDETTLFGFPLVGAGLGFPRLNLGPAVETIPACFVCRS
jgi:hypothetical protein